jgi:hypothetical protein
VCVQSRCLNERSFRTSVGVLGRPVCEQTTVVLLGLSFRAGSSLSPPPPPALLCPTLLGPGRLLNVVLLSWLYAYYCFDYKWAWQRTQLTDRLAAVEQRWAFFGGGVGPCGTRGGPWGEVGKNLGRGGGGRRDGWSQACTQCIPNPRTSTMILAHVRMMHGAACLIWS